MKTLSIIFKWLKKASLTLNLAKCYFGRATVTYLGKEVGQGPGHPQLCSAQNQMWTSPLSDYGWLLLRLLKNFADVVVPLTSLTSATKSFVWSPEFQNAFNLPKLLSAAHLSLQHLISHVPLSWRWMQTPALLVHCCCSAAAGGWAWGCWLHLLVDT